MPNDVEQALTPRQRQRKISEMVLERESVSAQALAGLFGVSVMTVHRDLDELERQGILRKFRGGVTASASGVFESNVAFRRNAMRAEKQAIAKHAARYVESGTSILVDDSTTTAEMIPHLQELAPLRVATYYLDAIRQLSQLDGIAVMALGGDYVRAFDSFLGSMCEASIDSIRVDALFVSTSAISGGRAYHQEDRSMTVKRKAMKIATRRYLLVDHTKIGKTGLRLLAPLSEFDLVIVDSGLSESSRADLEANDVNYEVAPAG
jgi:DeoR/GlpR family transcriptional regulator of sugar metabolism